MSIIPFYTPFNKTLARASDCYLYDSDGKEYIDLEAGVWCANLGHNNPRISQVIIDQVCKCMHHGYSFSNDYAEKLSLLLNEKTGIQNGQSVFLSSGSEAVNLSVTLAMLLTGRNKMAKIDNSYLSAYGHGKISEKNPNLVNISYNDIESAENTDYSQIAALVLETGGASVDMVRFPEKLFIDTLVKKAREKGCIVIADEVTTGFGRLGKWFGFEHYEIKPDIVVTGKALGNGYPVSGVTVSREIAENFGKTPFRYAQSHQNDPLGCRIGAEVIIILETEKIIDSSFETGLYFKNQLEEFQMAYPDKVKEIRAKGMMLAVELFDNCNVQVLNKRLFEKGFVAGCKTNSLRFLPPLTIQNEHINKLISTLENLFTKI